MTNADSFAGAQLLRWRSVREVVPERRGLRTLRMMGRVDNRRKQAGMRKQVREI